MALMEYTVSWETPIQDPNLKGWRIYASEAEDQRGTLVASAEPAARTVTFEIEEGEWLFTVVPVSNADVEGDWRKSKGRVKSLVTGRGTKPISTPETVAIQQVSPDVSARVTVDPVPADEDAVKVQVIEGEDPETGVLVAEVDVPKAGPREESAPLPSPTFPLDGSSDDGASTRTLQVRPISKGGTPGPAVERTVVMAERTQMAGVLLASVDTSGGGSLTGFPTPASGDFFSHVAADGLKTKRLPALSDSAAWAAYGASDTGARWTTLPFAPYPTVVKIESNELDVGANLAFILECRAQVQRVTAVGVLPSLPGWALSVYRGAPSVNARIVNENLDGPDWAFRRVTGEGKCKQPIRFTRWEYVIGTSSSVAHADGDYKPLVSGAWVKGRYLRVRLVIIDPVGWHQIKTGDVRVYARIPRLDRSGSGTPESTVTAPPGSRYLETGGGRLFVKGSGTGATGWVNVADRPVEAFAGHDTLTAVESGKTCTNEGAGALISLTLPAAVAGLEFTFIVMAAQTLQIKLPGTDVARVAGALTTGGGTASSSAVGDAITLKCVNGTTWVATSFVGTWALA